VLGAASTSTRMMVHDAALWCAARDLAEAEAALWEAYACGKFVDQRNADPQTDNPARSARGSRDGKASASAGGRTRVAAVLDASSRKRNRCVHHP